MKFLQRWLVTTIGVLLADVWVDGIHHQSFGALLEASLLLGLLNAFVRPLLMLISPPAAHRHPGSLRVGHQCGAPESGGWHASTGFRGGWIQVCLLGWGGHQSRFVGGQRIPGARIQDPVSGEHPRIDRASSAEKAG